MVFNELLTAPVLMVSFDRWIKRAGADLHYVPDVYTAFKHIFVAMILNDVLFSIFGYCLDPLLEIIIW